MPKFAVITSFLGRTKDRFHEYNEAKGLEDKFALLKTIDGASGVEVVYPYEVTDPAATRALAAKHGIAFAAINANVNTKRCGRLRPTRTKNQFASRGSTHRHTNTSRGSPIQSDSAGSGVVGWTPSGTSRSAISLPNGTSSGSTSITAVAVAKARTVKDIRSATTPPDTAAPTDRVFCRPADCTSE